MRSRIYFRNLNGLRFIAALFVIIHHIEQLKSVFNLPNYWSNPFINKVGHQGVILFFVLSGFLITYLLLKEKKETQTVSISGFYMRRILRIWPLYYLIIFLGLVILPMLPVFDIPGYIEHTYDNIGIKTILLFVFLPNLVNILYQPISFISQAWSIGVEEQFYLIWPVLIKKFKSVLVMLSLVITGYIACKFFLLHFHIKNPTNFTLMVLSEFCNSFSIDCMVLGGFGAYVLFHRKSALLSILFNTYVQLFVYLLTAYLLTTGTTVYFFNEELYGILFSIIIVNLSSNEKSIINLEYKPLNYLGKISYGLYMYHAICILVILKFALFTGIENNFFIYPASLLLSIAISAASYEFFEYRFIKAKAKHSRIISGAEAIESPESKKNSQAPA